MPDGPPQELYAFPQYLPNFAKLPLREIQTQPTLTYKEAVNRNLIASAFQIGQLYIPNFSPHEMANLTTTLQWGAENSEVFLFGGFIGGVGFDQLPDFAQGHILTAQACQLILRETDREDSNIMQAICTYPIGSDEWRDHIFNLTSTKQQQFRLHPFEADKQFNPNFDSTTRSLRLINNLYSSCGEKDREQARDVIISLLLRHYFFRLKQICQQAPLPNL